MAKTPSTDPNQGLQRSSTSTMPSTPLSSRDCIDAENVDVEYKNGILTVAIPKTEQSRGHRIAVKA